MGDARVFQEHAEAAVTGQDTAARVSQGHVDAAVTGQTTDARLLQIVVEVAQPPATEVVASSGGSVETLSAVAVTQGAAFETWGSSTAQARCPSEWESLFASSTATGPWETHPAVSTVAAVVVESLAPISVTAVIWAEAGGELLLSSSCACAWEGSTPVDRRAVGNIESTGLLSATFTAPFESHGAIARTTASAWEATGVTTRSAVSPVEALRSGLAVTYTAPLETQQETVTTQHAAAWEAAAIAVTVGEASWEAVGSHRPHLVLTPGTRTAGSTITQGTRSAPSVRPSTRRAHTLEVQ